MSLGSWTSRCEICRHNNIFVHHIGWSKCPNKGSLQRLFDQGENVLLGTRPSHQLCRLKAFVQLPLIDRCNQRVTPHLMTTHQLTPTELCFIMQHMDCGDPCPFEWINAHNDAFSSYLSSGDEDVLGLIP